MNAATADLLRANLPAELLPKLRLPKLRPSTASTLPKRQYDDIEITIRKQFALLLGVDRFTIDIDQPLHAKMASDSQLDQLMQFICKTYGDEIVDIALPSSFQVGDESVEIRDLTIHQLS